MGVVAPSAEAGQLRRYVQLVEKWAPKVNLVSLDDVPHFMERHVVPALALGPLVRSLPHRRVLDVGSGSGLPGLPLAIQLPGSAITLIESRRRRANFLRQCVRELALVNVTVVCARVEEWSPPCRFDLIVSRAVTAPGKLASLTGHCLAACGFQLTTAGPRSAEDPLLVRGASLWSSHRSSSARLVLAHPQRTQNP